jgi:Fe2+ or Zn2+ uptake regulation protein
MSACELTLCRSSRPARVTVYENLGDESYHTKICDRCAKVLEVKDSDVLPDYNTVTSKLTKEYK